VVEGMDEEQADCTALVRCTAEALDDDMLEILLVSAQQVSLEICVNYAVRRKVVDDYTILSSSDEVHFRTLKRIFGDASRSDILQCWNMQANLAVWFPHVDVGVEDCMNSKY
jgi:molybdopterin converting factor small subunit